MDYKGKKLALFFFLTGVIVFSLFPIFWISVISLKPSKEALILPPRLLFVPIFDNYMMLLGIGKHQIAEIRRLSLTYVDYYIHTLLISSLATFLTILTGLLAAYSFARFMIKGRRHLLFWILTVRMMPPIVILVPIFLMFRTLRLLDTYFGLIVIYTAFNIPFAVWMIMGFIEKIPTELEECAMIDGCSRMQAFRRITFPLIVPGTAATAIFTLIMCWNEFPLALVLTGPKTATLPVGIQRFISTGVMGSYQWGQAGAGGILAIIPIVIFGILIQRHLAKGLTLGAVK